MGKNKNIILIVLLLTFSSIYGKSVWTPANKVKPKISVMVEYRNGKCIYRYKIENKRDAKQDLKRLEILTPKLSSLSAKIYRKKEEHEKWSLGRSGPTVKNKFLSWHSHKQDNLRAGQETKWLNEVVGMVLPNIHIFRAYGHITTPRFDEGMAEEPPKWHNKPYKDYTITPYYSFDEIATPNKAFTTLMDILLKAEEIKWINYKKEKSLKKKIVSLKATKDNSNNLKRKLQKLKIDFEDAEKKGLQVRSEINVLFDVYENYLEDLLKK